MATTKEKIEIEIGLKKYCVKCGNKKVTNLREYPICDKCIKKLARSF